VIQAAYVYYQNVWGRARCHCLNNHRTSLHANGGL
jgi:hypothetical protein